MAGFGGFGAGGMGASFPSRYEAPQSAAVGYMPDADTWNTGWQSRYDAEAAKRGQGAGLDREQFLNKELSNWGGGGKLTWDAGKDVPAFADHFMGGDSYGTAGRETEEDVFRQMMGGDLYDKLANYQPSAGYRPNFSALNAEKERMAPILESQTRQQQSYDSMRGWGQENAVMGPDYANAGFGQVNGQTGNPYAPDTQGVDMEWAKGYYEPQQGNTGVFGTASNPNTSRWGL